jgi:scyllo-inositol 2-dehydrogenase (NADP+)
MPLPAPFLPVRVGVAGLGRSGMFHVERLGLHDDCRVVALYDDCSAARDRAGMESAPMHPRWDEFLANRSIELVLLATPPAHHAELAIQALAAGKHVLVETPLCMNLAEADALVAASTRSGRCVSVFHARRWDDDFRAARLALASGELGRPLSMKFINWHYNPFPRGDTAAPGKVPSSSTDHFRLGPVDWRLHAQTGGGVLWEFGIHYFDQLLLLAGRLPQTVYGQVFPSIPGEPTDDGFLAIVSFPGDLVAHVEAHRAAAAPLPTGWTIVGDRGSYAGFTQFTATPEGEIVDIPLTRVSADADELYLEVFRHIRTGAANPVPVGQIRSVIALIEAVRRSARCGQVVPFEM